MTEASKSFVQSHSWRSRGLIRKVHDCWIDKLEEPDPGPVLRNPQWCDLCDCVDRKKTKETVLIEEAHRQTVSVGNNRPTTEA